MVLNRIVRTCLFTGCLVAIYLIIFFLFKELKFPLLRDEHRFWSTSLYFSHSLIPSLDQLRTYPELNTPLPFIVFGSLERLFHGGIFTGRLLNFILSFLIVFSIGAPLNRKPLYGILAAIGLLLFPYYLRLSTLLYTDIMATFFGFWGIWFYLKNRHLLSGISFILAIACRQFMLAFPVALILYEIASSLKTGFRFRLYWIAPLIAASTILGWFWLFGGLAPATGVAERDTAAVQLVLWAIAPNSSLVFLACVGLCFVIPEWILFNRTMNFHALLSRKTVWIAIGLLLLFMLFPPLQVSGLLNRLGGGLPIIPRMVLFYSLAFLTCIRFSQLNLAFWLLLANSGLMLKAYPWDKYTLPLITVFWYLKSINALDSLPEKTVTLQLPEQATQ